MVIACRTFFGRCLSTMFSVVRSFIPNIDRRFATVLPLPEPGPPVKYSLFYQREHVQKHSCSKGCFLSYVIPNMQMIFVVEGPVSATFSPIFIGMTGMFGSKTDCFRSLTFPVPSPPVLLLPQPMPCTGVGERKWPSTHYSSICPLTRNLVSNAARYHEYRAHVMHPH